MSSRFYLFAKGVLYSSLSKMFQCLIQSEFSHKYKPTQDDSHRPMLSSQAKRIHIQHTLLTRLVQKDEISHTEGSQPRRLMQRRERHRDDTWTDFSQLALRRRENIYDTFLKVRHTINGKYQRVKKTALHFFSVRDETLDSTTGSVSETLCD